MSLIWNDLQTVNFYRIPNMPSKWNEYMVYLYEKRFTIHCNMKKVRLMIQRTERYYHYELQIRKKELQFYITDWFIVEFRITCSAKISKIHGWTDIKISRKKILKLILVTAVSNSPLHRVAVMDKTCYNYHESLGLQAKNWNLHLHVF